VATIGFFLLPLRIAFEEAFINSKNRTLTSIRLGDDPETIRRKKDLSIPLNDENLANSAITPLEKNVSECLLRNCIFRENRMATLLNSCMKKYEEYKRPAPRKFSL
jgi:hypothetical protein